MITYENKANYESVLSSQTIVQESHTISTTCKNQNIIVIVPSRIMTPAKAAFSHWNLIFPQNNRMCRILTLGQEVGKAYSDAIEQIINHPDLSQFEYILTMETDNCPPTDGVIKLLEDMEKHPELSCIGGLYWSKGPGGHAHIWGDINDPVQNFRSQTPKPNTVQECYGTSMGFNLWRINMFKDTRLRTPWFKTTSKGTQDLYFWSDARQYGYRCAVDTSVIVGHYDYEHDIMYK